MSKPIDKKYLKNSLENFNKQVLINEYLKKDEVIENHTHSNKSTLDKLSENNGKLLFNETEIGGSQTEISTADLSNYYTKEESNVNFAKLGHIHSYNDLNDKPTIPTVSNDLSNELKVKYDDAVNNMHTHSNKDVLDKFSEVDGKVLYNGEEVRPDTLNIFSALNIHTSENELIGKAIAVNADNSVICNTKFDNDGKATAILYKVDKAINPEYSVTCEDVEETIVMDNEGIYDIELSFLSSYIDVTTNVENSTVIVELISVEGKEYKKEAVVDSSGSVRIKVGVLGKYKVYSTYKTGISSSETVEITENEQIKNISLKFATLVLTTTIEKYIGLTITIKSGDDIISTFVNTNNDVIYLPSLQTYTLSSNISENTYALKVANYTTYTKSIEDIGIARTYKLVTFADGTEEEIIAMINAHYNDEIDISDYWTVGDSRIIHINEIPYSSTFAETTPEQNIKVRIIGIEHDNLVESINGHTKACVTIETIPGLFTYSGTSTSRYKTYIEGLASNGKIQYRYDWLNNNFKAALSETLNDNVKEVVKSVQTSLDRTKAIDTNFYCFIVTSKELTGDYTNALIKSEQGEQYEYYKVLSNILEDNYINTKESQSCVKFLFSEYKRDTDAYITRTSSTSTGLDPGGMGGYYYCLSPAFCL